MSETMVERMARAMWLARYGSDGLPSTLPFDDAAEDTRDKFRFMALAALRIMRDPTHAMEKAMEEADGATFATVSGVYQRGIDAAIHEAENAK